jgi:hypothetical protein
LRKNGLLERRAPFVQQNPFCPAVSGVGLSVRITDGCQPYSSVLGQAADHVKHDTGLPGLVEVQAVPRDDVEQVVDAQPAQQSDSRSSVATTCFPGPPVSGTERSSGHSGRR